MKNKILQDGNLFIKFPDYRRGYSPHVPDIYMFRLKETNLYYIATTKSWAKRIEYTESLMTFEDLFNELVIDEMISNQRKELILFNLVDLRNLGR